MVKSKPATPPQTDGQSLPVSDEMADKPADINSNARDQQTVSPVPGGPQSQSQSQSTADPSSQYTDDSLNISTANTSVAEPSSQESFKKPSSNFTLIERTFILMAIAAVRADPKWRTYEDPAHPDAMKDFCEPFCHAVREKLMEDPDFKGRVTVLADESGRRCRRPSKLSIWKIWANLYLNGSLTRPRHNLGRKKDFAAEERVKQYLKSNPDCKMSSRAIAAQTQTSHRNVIRIMQQENLAIRRTKFKRVDESVKKRSRKSAKTTNKKND